VIDVPLGPPYWAERPEGEDPSVTLRGRVMPPALAMQCAIVFEQADLVVAQVLVREGEETPGGSSVGQAVYWVGMSLSSSGLTASSLRLATDTVDYFACAKAATPPNVVAWTIKPGDTFAAEVEIEPPHQIEFFSGDPITDAEKRLALNAPACATAAVVTWRNGFDIAHRDEPETCPDSLPARFVQIDDRGHIQLVARPLTGGRTM
jgi:hypothetical protein